MTSLISGVHLPVERLCSEQPSIVVFDFQLEVVNYRFLMRISWPLLCPAHRRVAQLPPEYRAHCRPGADVLAWVCRSRWRFSSHPLLVRLP